MSHAIFIPSIYIFIVFEVSMFQEMKGYTGRSTLPQVTHYTRKKNIKKEKKAEKEKQKEEEKEK